MELDVAKQLLSTCVKREQRNHEFGCMDVEWYDGDNLIAGAFFGAGISNVSVEITNSEWAVFEDEEARELLGCFASVRVERVDETGPEEFELK